MSQIKPAPPKEVPEDPAAIDPGVKPLPPAPPPPKIYTYVEQMPQANYDVNNYIRNNIRYPDLARKGNVSGKVLVKFIVNEDGTISDPTIVRGLGSGCDEEALRLINKMPKWNPGKQGGVAVKTNFSLLVLFTPQ